MGYRRMGRGLGDCVIDPVNGPTCDASIVNPGFPTLASLSTGSILTGPGAAAAAAPSTLLGMSTTTWLLIGTVVVFASLLGGRR
jgi:hypothetical protein